MGLTYTLPSTDVPSDGGSETTTSVNSASTSLVDYVDISMGGDDDDLVITTDIEFTYDADSVLQLCLERLGTIKSEWFLDLDEGFPYFETETVTSSEAILGSKFDEIKIRANVTDILVSTPGVNSVSSLQVSFVQSTRTVTVRFIVLTTFGVINGEVVI